MVVALMSWESAAYYYYLLLDTFCNCDFITSVFKQNYR
jgi:hypothetical protein